MKTEKCILLLIALIVLLVIVDKIFPQGDEILDRHENCDAFEYYMRDYQIELHMDTVWIYQQDRLVDSFITNYNCYYDSVFIKDNE